MSCWISSPSRKKKLFLQEVQQNSQNNFQRSGLSYIPIHKTLWPVKWNMLFHQAWFIWPTFGSGEAVASFIQTTKSGSKGGGWESNSSKENLRVTTRNGWWADKCTDIRNWYRVRKMDAHRGRALPDQASLPLWAANSHPRGNTRKCFEGMFLSEIPASHRL